MEGLYNLLSEIPDVRRKQGVKFSYAAFLEMVILAGMSGRFGINNISRFIKSNEEFFKSRYQLKYGTPCQTTIFNILKAVDFSEVNKFLIKWMTPYIETQEEVWLSIDGKVLCSTVTDANNNKQNFQSIVSAFCSSKDIVVTCKEFENNKSNEIKAAQDLIDQLEIKGVTMTLDALHCQKKQLTKSWWEEMTT